MTSPYLYAYDTPCGVQAFSTMRGEGESCDAYASFNVTDYCGDSPIRVEKNKAILCEALSIEPSCLVYPHQTHGNRVLGVDSDFLNLSCVERKEQLDGIDALVTDLPGICVAVSTADCVPVLLCDTRRRVCAAVHAGWRGTVSRIVANTIDFMRHNYASVPQDIEAFIGPSISLEAFEVGDEVFEAFRCAGFPMDLMAKRFPPGKWHLDLWQANSFLLSSCGLKEENIHVAGICTYASYDSFFSARRLSINSGRILSGIFFK